MSSNKYILQLDCTLDKIFKTNVNTDLVVAITGVVIAILLTVLVLWVSCKIYDLLESHKFNKMTKKKYRKRK